MARRGAIVALGCLALAVAGTAGLSLAQDQNQITQAAPLPPDEAAPAAAPPTPSSPSATDNAVAEPPVEATPAPLDLPPPVAAAPSAPSANVVAETALPPPPPDKRPNYPVVVLQALDKATAETLRFEAKVGEPIRYKDLVIVPHACQTQAADERYTQTAADLEVQFQPQDQPLNGQAVARQVFQGWMFADSPGLHPFQHPTYDLWVIACKAASPAPAVAPAAGAHL